MYSKQEAAQSRKEFWTSFGQYMMPVPSAEGGRANWLNYKTGEKSVYFRLHADNKLARVAIELTHTDEGLRQLYYEQFVQLKALLHAALGEEWTWHPAATDDYGKAIARIGREEEGVSVLRRQDWPRLISFFKPRIVALDEFWSDARYTFEALR